MSLQKILEEDWSEYESHSRGWQASYFILCEDAWEIDYLVSKIKPYYPQLSEQNIEKAIAMCCRKMPFPRLREAFMECVLSQLDTYQE